MRLILSRGAQNGLYGMSRPDRQRMLAKLEAFAAEPFAPHSWATRLQGEDRVRIRQDDWRGVLLIVRKQDTVVLERGAHRGLTREVLAGKAGVAPSYLTEIETRRKPGSFDALAKLAQALDVSLDELAPWMRRCGAKSD